VLLAAGLGCGPVLAALTPWPPVAVVAALAGALLLGSTALHAERRVAVLDLELGRTPWRWPQGIVTDAGLVCTTLAALAACLHATWALAGLLQAALGGSSLAANADGGGWAHAGGWNALPPGWRGSPALLAGLFGVLLLLALLLRDGRPGRRAGWLLLAALVVQAAVGVLGWWSQPEAGASLLGPWRAPAAWTDAAREAGAGFAAGVLACGAGLGLVQARALLEGAPPHGPVGRAVLLGPAAVLVGALAVLPWRPLLPSAPFAAPLPDGSASAALLLEPLATHAGAGWHLAWLAALLAASVATLMLALQPARLVVQGLLGLTTAASSGVLCALLAALALPCLLLPGLSARLPALLAASVLVASVAWLAADPPTGLAPRSLRLLAGLAALGALLAGLHPDTTWALQRLPPGWDEAALLGQADLLLLAVPLLALAWWPALLLLAAFRARPLSPDAPPADPAALRRTRA
jgi:hypothetical protein